MSNVLEIVVQRAAQIDGVPSDAELEFWVSQVLSAFDAAGEVTLRIVEDQEMQALNRDYRQQDKLTNVLSFEVDAETRINHQLLGDVVICASVVANEAKQQQKSLNAHWAHMVTHGMLHLLGYDHISDEQAQEMEAHEIKLLAQFGFADPYQPIPGNQSQQTDVDNKAVTQQGNQHV